MSLGKKAYKLLGRLYEANVILPFTERAPVLVYQMGKVGSSSVWHSLREHGVKPTFHLHWFYPWREREAAELPVDEALRQDVATEIVQERRAFKNFSLRKKVRAMLLENWHHRVVYEKAIEKGREVKIITNVRDPVSTNVSMFFQSFSEYAEGTDFGEESYSVEDIIDIFESNYLLSWPLTWFDKEMKHMLGIDVYKYPFPKERGHQCIEEGNYKLLLLKCELDDKTKERAIADFLDLEEFRLERKNVSKDKTYAEQYQKFKKDFSVRDSTLRRLCNSKYAEHFYTAEELETVRERWKR